MFPQRYVLLLFLSCQKIGFGLVVPLPKDIPASLSDLSNVPYASKAAVFDLMPLNSFTMAAADDLTSVIADQQTPSEIIAIFIAGLVPFAVATVEFWRRIAVGSPFGTGGDRVFIIGEEDRPLSSRGSRVLGKGALYTAYAIFVVSAAVLALTIYSVMSSNVQPETTLETMTEQMISDASQ